MMRIIAGIYKGRILKSPSEKSNIRPTTDRARETIFNILKNKIDFENKSCLDLFCGTGSLGLEFISRGGNKCTFVDTCIKTIKENINILKIEKKYEIIKMDVIKYLKLCNKYEYNLAFADPPYSFFHYHKLIEEISKFKVIFILEYNKNLTINNNFNKHIFMQKKIGISTFSFFDFNNTL